MKFNEIPGLKDVKKSVQAMYRDDRIPHAILIHGRAGSGKLALALALAQLLVCKNPLNEEACGHCTGCLKAQKYIHPDVHFVFPVIKKDGKKREDTTASDFLTEWREILLSHPYFSFQEWAQAINAENSPPNINTRECNEIIHKLGLKTFESDAKVLLIWMPEYLGKEGNRLLKIIEEPTDNTFIIIIAEQLDLILNTILSRTQLVYVPPFTDEAILNYLNSIEFSDSPDRLQQIITLADGNLGMAINGSTMPGMDFSDLLFDWIRVSYKSPPERLIAFVNQLAQMGREQQKNFLKYGLHFFREYLFFLFTGKRGKRLNDKEYDIAQKMKKIMDLEKCQTLVELLNNSIIHIGRNANPKIGFMADSLSIGRIMRSEKVIVI